MTPTWGPDYWPWLLIAVSLAVLGPEIYALLTNTANTLSWYSWHELQITPHEAFKRHNAAWRLSQGTFLVVTFWLWLHIWYMTFR